MHFPDPGASQRSDHPLDPAGPDMPQCDSHTIDALAPDGHDKCSKQNSGFQCCGYPFVVLFLRFYVAGTRQLPVRPLNDTYHVLEAPGRAETPEAPPLTWETP